MPLEVILDPDSLVPVYRQIFDAVVAALVTGQLKPEEQLPTIHGLAAALDVNPNTIIRAYRELEVGGHVRSQRGRGTYPVARKQPSESPKSAALRKILVSVLVQCR